MSQNCRLSSIVGKDLTCLSILARCKACKIELSLKISVLGLKCIYFLLAEFVENSLCILVLALNDITNTLVEGLTICTVFLGYNILEVGDGLPVITTIYVIA